MKKTGLFFGSFNPIHVGHLIIAEQMVANTEMDEVWFVVSPQNPFKDKKNLLDKRHRIYMVNIAIEENYHLQASDIEFDLPVPSYTIDTLAHLKEQHPGKEFALLMGSDNILSFHKWKNYEIILRDHEIYIYPRPGFDPKPAIDQLQEGSIHLVEMPLLHLSATEIRKRISEGRSVRYLLTEPVRNFVEEMHLYK